MRPIRILVDSFADEDALNAQMTNARDIVSRLDPERFHVSMFVVGKADARLVQRPSTRLIQLPSRRQTLPILNEFLRGRHDILFYVKASPAARVYLMTRLKWVDKRVVIGTAESQSDLRNEPTIHPDYIRLWERTILRSDFIFSNSASVKASLLKEYGIASEVTPTGVDTKFFTPAEGRAANSRLRVLFVGSLRPFKGPQLLLRAAAQFPAVDFAVAGDGIMSEDLRGQARAEGLRNVQFLGALNRTALREQYRRSDIFLFPSRWEGSPKVIMEAAASGLPVIARKDYEPETVLHAETGYLGRNDDELIAYLGELISNAELREQMGRCARLHIERFDWDLITRQWEEAFIKLASRGGGPRGT
jgi:glycosyltransferase involved in cell wall biosynthesis